MVVSPSGLVILSEWGGGNRLCWSPLVVVYKLKYSETLA